MSPFFVPSGDLDVPEGFSKNGDTLDPNSVRMTLQKLRDEETEKPLAIFALSNDKRVTDMIIKPHSLNRYDALNLTEGRCCSLFSWLSVSSEGQQIILDHSQLLKGVTVENLTLAMTAQAGTVENCTPLYWLASSPEGRRTLLKHPPLLEGLTGKDLTLAITAQAGALENSTPLYWLACTPEGQEILLKHPRLLEGLTGKDLTLAMTAKAGADENFTPLHWLAGTPNGKKILRKHPQLLEGVTVKDLTLAGTAQAGFDENCTPLDWLVNSSDGQATPHGSNQVGVLEASEVASTAVNRASEVGFFSSSKSEHQDLSHGKKPMVGGGEKHC